jgi:hypothetical protein
VFVGVGDQGRARRHRHRWARRRIGIDAGIVARQLLAGRATAKPRMADGAVEALRLLPENRRPTAGNRRRRAARPRADTTHPLVTACAALDVIRELADRQGATRHTLGTRPAAAWIKIYTVR